MERPLRPQAARRENEPAAIRNLSKSQIYSTLSEEVYLPPKESKGVNREYIVRVYMNEALRIPLIEYKRFEAELTPLQRKKAPFVNLLDLYQKANQLLASMGHNQFGFSNNLIPEEKWMMNVIRFVDRPNVLGAYLRPLNVPDEFQNMDIYVMKTAQKNAGDWLSRGATIQNSTFWSLKSSLWEAVRRLRSTEKDIEQAEAHLQRLRVKRGEEQDSVDNKRTAFGLAVFNIRQPGANINQQAAFMRNEDARTELAQIIELYTSIYLRTTFAFVLDTVRNIGDELAINGVVMFRCSES